jgi:predicted lipid-binding transport protein (Tim44 family)
MSRVRTAGGRLATALVGALLLVALSATPALAAAGGGSGGFGGGGGGGRGGGHGGGGFLIFFLLTHPLILAILIGCWLLYKFTSAAGATVESARERAQRRKRGDRVQLAAAEAAEDDAAFAPDAVLGDARQLFTEIQAAWDRGDRVRLRQLVGPDLMVEWERRLDDFARRGWRNRVEVLDGPRVEYVSLTNRGSAAEDRVVVHVEARMRDFVTDRYGSVITHEEASSDTRTLSEYWTLAKSGAGGRWMLASIEGTKEGAHNLSNDLLANPWDDTGRLRDEALVEGAAAETLPEGMKASELVSVSYENDARAAALDISLVDGRFAPDVLEVAVRRVVDAWAEAVDGSDSRLRAISSGDALSELLHPGDPSARTRLVIRGPRVLSVSIEDLDGDADPARMTVAVEAEGRRYIEDRDTTTVVAGSRKAVTRFSERWVLALDGPPESPWRIVDAAAARAA